MIRKQAGTWNEVSLPVFSLMNKLVNFISIKPYYGVSVDY